MIPLVYHFFCPFFILAILLFFHFSYLLLPHLARCHEGLQLAGLLDGGGEVLIARLRDEDIVLDAASG